MTSLDADSEIDERFTGVGRAEFQTPRFVTGLDFSSFLDALVGAVIPALFDCLSGRSAHFPESR